MFRFLRFEAGAYSQRYEAHQPWPANAGPRLQSRFYDRALRTVKEYGETADYIHWNPVRRGYVSKPEARVKPFVNVTLG